MTRCADCIHCYAQSQQCCQQADAVSHPEAAKQEKTLEECNSSAAIRSQAHIIYCGPEPAANLYVSDVPFGRRSSIEASMFCSSLGSGIWAICSIPFSGGLLFCMIFTHTYTQKRDSTFMCDIHTETHTKNTLNRDRQGFTNLFQIIYFHSYRSVNSSVGKMCRMMQQH